MLTVVDSLGSMSKALERFADCPRPSKRQKREELSDSDTNSNDEANHSDVDSREFKQITTAGATTAIVTEKIWGEYGAVVF